MIIGDIKNINIICSLIAADFSILAKEYDLGNASGSTETSDLFIRFLCRKKHMKSGQLTVASNNEN